VWALFAVRWPPVRTLSEDEVRQHLDPACLVRELETAFRDRFTQVTIPARMHIPLDTGIFLIMPCHDLAGHALGMKLVTVQSQPAHSEDRIQATVMLFDLETGKPHLVMAAKYLTELRTAAASAVATKFLARKDARTLGIFGTGRQARAHLKVLPLIRNFDRVLVCGKDHSSSKEFCEQVAGEITLPVEPAGPDRCAAESDVLCTCTTSPSPLFDGKLLRPGTHLNLVGSFQPQAREVDSFTIERALLVVDTYDAALIEAGDLLIPIGEGVIKRDHVQADLHELVSGSVAGRPADITVFKSVGCAFEDLIAAELVAENVTTREGALFRVTT
jgi:alanine dehydrogenase